ncbi:hypothetical protein PROFUN_12081 [Planoprotostelium fungivorum]|uniref:N-acetyltransferase domain-containing protein n=1 Tax=Planoprotostelium fungivorum TaxID=1890364 RepID=A0A2P6N8Q6_9EUKA|nr:hypothetical protein PROFUN_12081 [Planoprotostelium fungivorum]
MSNMKREEDDTGKRECERCGGLVTREVGTDNTQCVNCTNQRTERPSPSTTKQESKPSITPLLVAGVCSWTDPDLTSSGKFYPSTVKNNMDKLEFYSRKFPCVEIDMSTYAIPSSAQCQKWSKATHKGFTFHVKAFQLFTQLSCDMASLPQVIRSHIEGDSKSHVHIGGNDGRERIEYSKLSEASRDKLWEHYNESIHPLHEAGKMGVVLFQFAPNVDPSTDLGRNHILSCRRGLDEKYRMVVEFRSNAWMTDGGVYHDTIQWLRDHHVPLASVDEIVDTDHPSEEVKREAVVDEVLREDEMAVGTSGKTSNIRRDRPLALVYTHGDFLYVRVHRRKGNNRKMSEEELKDWSHRLHHVVKKVEGPLTVYLLMNTHHDNQSVENAESLQWRKQFDEAKGSLMMFLKQGNDGKVKKEEGGERVEKREAPKLESPGIKIAGELSVYYGLESLLEISDLADQVVQLIRQNFDVESDEPSQSTKDFLLDVCSYHEPNQIYWYVFKDGHRLLAVCAGNLYPSAVGQKMFLLNLCVQKDLQGLGLGTQFLLSIGRDTLSRGVTKIIGAVDAKNERLHRLYQTIGARLLPPTSISSDRTQRLVIRFDAGQSVGVRLVPQKRFDGTSSFTCLFIFRGCGPALFASFLLENKNNPSLEVLPPQSFLYHFLKSSLLDSQVFPTNSAFYDPSNADAEHLLGFLKLRSSRLIALGTPGHPTKLIFLSGERINTGACEGTSYTDEFSIALKLTFVHRSNNQKIRKYKKIVQKRLSEHTTR